MSKQKKNYFLDKAGLYLMALIVIGGLLAYGCNSSDARKKATVKKEKAPVTEDVQTPAVVEKETTPLEKLQPQEQKSAIAYEPQDIQPTPGNNSYSIFIDKGKYRLYIYDGTRPIAEYPVAIGKNPGQKKAVGDLTTPTGEFSVDEIDEASTWTHDFGDGKGVIEGAYGPWFISLRTGWDGIGIHGTHDDTSIGKMVSEGCVRMHNQDLRVVKRFVHVGTPVTIKEHIDVKS